MPNHAPLESRPPLIAALLRPDAYPHPVSEPIRLAETHISWVVLTGELAYKIKKPVSLAFLDYSTVDRRLAFCAEELRLNRRHAPGLYLGVSRITGSPAAPTVDGPGEPIEHAVRMRQFAARDELPSLLAADAVTADEVAELGGDVARLHAAAMPTPVDAAWGRAATVERITVDNFAELRRLPEGIECRDALQSIESGLLDSRQVRTALLERRHAAVPHEARAEAAVDQAGSVAQRDLSAATIASLVASGSKRAMFSATVPANKATS